MRHRIFAVASAISLLLCIGTALLWAASWIDGATVSQGRLLVFHADDPDGKFEGHVRTAQHLSTAVIWRMLQSDSSHLVERAGFTFGSGIYNPGYIAANYTVLAIPLWAILLAFTVLPAVWVSQRLRTRSRIRSGCCVSCGYDLRASSDHCPECGTPVRPPGVPSTV